MKEITLDEVFNKWQRLKILHGSRENFGQYYDRLKINYRII